jgi:Dyp-type peroxidase family
MNKLISSKHLEGVSDLTLTAPIKRGFVDAFESITYETRLRIVMKALFKIRATAREHSLIKPFVDTAERIQSLLDFRLTILDDHEPHQLMLSATFDRPFEPYMRLIWDPLGPLLDVIFCNCEGYVTATEHGFEDYLAWVRKSQKDTSFFYTATGLSVDDIQYLTQIERLEREHSRARPASIVTATPEQLARRVRGKKANKRLTNQMGMQALVSLYRLADFYPPDQPDGDGKFLLWATQQLLAGWGREDLEELGWDDLVREQLRWLEGAPWPRQKTAAQRLTFDPEGVQGGIVNNYGEVCQGALLLMRIADPEKARKFIGRLPVRRERDPRKRGAAAAANRSPFLNLAFTRHGLANIGVPDSELERFPQAFREGMEERAGLLLDVRHNHPRRWALPARNWPGPPSGPAASVDMSEIDIVIQLRTTQDHPNSDIVGDESHPLHKWVHQLAGWSWSGLELLAVEPMRRAPPVEGIASPEHFGFADGKSQPIPVDGKPSYANDEVARSEIFWGYSNDRGDAPPPPSPILDDGTFLVVRKLSQDVGALDRFVAKACEEHQLDPNLLRGKMMGRLPDGKTLVDLARTDNKFDYEDDKEGKLCPFQAHVRRTNPRTEAVDGRRTPRILRRGMSYGPPYKGAENEERGIFFMAYNASISEQYEVIQRWVNGGNSTGVASWQNDPLMGVSQMGAPRTFQFDNEGQRISLRMEEPFVRLQWGAYLFVPSIAAIRTISALSPVDAAANAREAQLREARRGERIVARLLALASEGPEGKVAAAAGWKTCLEDFGEKDPAELGEGPAVWAALRAYHGGALRVPYGIVAEGETPPEVVLVAGKDLVMRVFENGERHYSMRGQMARMKQSFGPIFLGLDEGEDYREISRINETIMEIGRPVAFALAYSTAAAWLEEVMGLFCRIYGPPQEPPGEGRWGELDLRRDFITPVLAGICNFWFGIPDSLAVEANPKLGVTHKPTVIDACRPAHVVPGGWSWNAVHKPLCPGHFLATSRYCFYPDPVPRVQAYGKAQGRKLREAARAHFQEKRNPAAPIAEALAKLFASRPGDKEDEIARTLIGVMTGFLPPTDASLRWTLYEWLEEKSFWRLQHALVSAPPAAPLDPAALPKPLAEWLRKAGAIYQQAGMPPAQLEALGPGMLRVLAQLPRAEAALYEPLKRAMQKRPSPDMLWRTAVRDHRLGEVDVRDGDRVFIGIVSALAEDADAGVTDVYPVFGGNRSEANPPLHACPAYEFAMGTMLGILAALMDKVRVEALPAPLIVRVSDRVECAPLQDAACAGAPAVAVGTPAPRQCPYQEPAQPGTGLPADAHGVSS